ncbi:MAG: hypothetical protein AAGE59_37805 [Cyanobacteria bacterium P01_F01_bin.86]
MAKLSPLIIIVVTVGDILTTLTTSKRSPITTLPRSLAGINSLKAS